MNFLRITAVTLIILCLSSDCSKAGEPYVNPLYKTDTLLWLKISSRFSSRSKEKMQYKEAVTYCDNLEETGCNDWVLPSVNQLSELTRLRAEWEDESLWTRSKVCLTRYKADKQEMEAEICNDVDCPGVCKKAQFNSREVISANDNDIAYVKCVKKE